MMGFNGLMDDACAEALGVSLNEYITKIESCDTETANKIIFGIFEEDGHTLEEAKKLFSEIM